MILMKGLLVTPEHESQVTTDDRVNRKGRIRGSVYGFFSPRSSKCEREEKEGRLPSFKTRNIRIHLCTTGIIK